MTDTPREAWEAEWEVRWEERLAEPPVKDAFTNKPVELVYRPPWALYRMGFLDGIEADRQDPNNPLRKELDALNKPMPCGHAQRYVSTSDESTSFCVWCAWDAAKKERAAYNKEVVEPMAKEVEETIRILRERQLLADADCLALVIQRYYDAQEGR